MKLSRILMFYRKRFSSTIDWGSQKNCNSQPQTQWVQWVLCLKWIGKDFAESMLWIATPDSRGPISSLFCEVSFWPWVSLSFCEVVVEAKSFIIGNCLFDNVLEMDENAVSSFFRKDGLKVIITSYYLQSAPDVFEIDGDSVSAGDRDWARVVVNDGVDQNDNSAASTLRSVITVGWETWN